VEHLVNQGLGRTPARLRPAFRRIFRSQARFRIGEGADRGLEMWVGLASGFDPVEYAPQIRFHLHGTLFEVASHGFVDEAVQRGFQDFTQHRKIRLEPRFQPESRRLPASRFQSFARSVLYLLRCHAQNLPQTMVMSIYVFDIKNGKR
jgi:hypothetical protein